MANKKGLQRNRGGVGVGGSGSRFPITIVIFLSILVPLLFFVGRGIFTTAATAPFGQYLFVCMFVIFKLAIYVIRSEFRNLNVV